MLNARDEKHLLGCKGKTHWSFCQFTVSAVGNCLFLKVNLIFILSSCIVLIVLFFLSSKNLKLIEEQNLPHKLLMWNGKATFLSSWCSNYWKDMCLKNLIRLKFSFSWYCSEIQRIIHIFREQFTFWSPSSEWQVFFFLTTYT